MTNDNYFPTEYQEFIHLSRYARWLESEGRRETWEETVDRYIGYMIDEKCAGKIDDGTRGEIREGMLKLEVMPSMRCLMTSGPALRRDEAAGYNCSYLAIDDIAAFDEMLYLLMCGTGAGFSVERQFIDKLPDVAERLRSSKTTITVEDSKIGWANAYRELISMLYQGRIPEFDVSQVRKAGERLKTFGGRSSGPGPLIDLFKFTISTFKQACGRKLNSLECHDLCCKIGEIVVVGGVRRCLPEGALVQTVNGLVPIEDINPGDMIITGGESAKVVAQVESGEQDILNIKHENGDIQVTRKHRMAVLLPGTDGHPVMKFKRADQLTVNDVLVWDLAGTNGIKTKLPEVTGNGHFNENEVFTPDLDEEIAWLIGVVHGYGCVNSRSISITTATDQVAILEKSLSIFKRFGISGSITDGHGDCLRLRINSKPLADWFKMHIKRSNIPIEIPSFIINSTRNIRWAYLAGLFDADGRSREDGRLDQMSSIYKDFGYSVRSLLSSLGIGVYYGNVSAERRRKNGEQAHDSCTLSIKGNTNRERWIREVGQFSISGKLDPDRKFSSPDDYRYPVELLDYPKGWKKTSSVTYQTAISRGFVKPSPYAPTPICEISIIGTANTYDIEVENINRFTTSGLVVHNSALISLSNPSDDRMRHAKTGEWWNTAGHRALANNSACYTEKPESDRFLREWLALIESKSGERGIFNRAAAKKVVERNGRRDPNHEFGCNPCSEILLRSCGFCNLSEVVVRSTDTVEDVERKVRLATIVGTIQSTLTDFRYLRKKWQDNAEEECLLGVSLTGVMDNKLFSGRDGKKNLSAALDGLREYAISVNKEWSKKLGVNQSVAITCNKPSGCRPWDSLVTTDNGILTLEELFENHQYGDKWGDYSGSSSAMIEDGKTTPITKTYVNGKSPVLEIEMNFGLTVRSTPNHKWFVKSHKSTSWEKKVNQWKRTDEIVPGDILETNIGNYRNEIPTRMRSLTSQAIRMREDATEIKQPEEMSEKLAWLIGYLWGDGAQSPAKYRIRFTEEHEDVISHVADTIHELFGIECEYFRAHDGRNAWQLEVASKMLWHWMIKNDIWKYYADELDIIPSIVRRSSWRHVVAFMSGMIDSDGWVNEIKGGDIKATLTSSYDMLSRHLQQVSWAVGLCFGRSHNTQGENFQKVKSMYLMCLGGNTDPEAMKCLAANSVKHRRFMSDKWHATNCSKTQIPGKVKGVKAIGVMSTYDIETDCHWFYDGAVKSHNTVSQLVDCSSGIHPRFSEYYIRTVRADKKDPLAKLMADLGFPCEDDVTKPEHNYVFSFPMKAPDCAIMSDDMRAMEQLELWLQYQRHWTEHKPSITVYVRDHEWVEVGAWVYKHFDEVSGISFLPYSGHTYQQAPYQEISKAEYLDLLDAMPQDVDWSLLKAYEEDDTHITAHKEYACVGGACEKVDLVKGDGENG